MQQESNVPTRKLQAASLTSAIVAGFIAALQVLGYIDFGEKGLNQIEVLTPLIGLLIGPIVGYFVPPATQDGIRVA